MSANCNFHGRKLFQKGHLHEAMNTLQLMNEIQIKAKPINHLSGQVFQIYGDDVGLMADGDLFVVCIVCAFPMCRPCYDYERKDGKQSCLQCKTRYKRHQGCP